MHSSTLCEQAFDVTAHTGYTTWIRPKTGKHLRAKMPVSEARLVNRCIATGSLPNSTSTLRRWVRTIGDRAGYAEQAVSPLTFRHSRAVWLLDEGMPVHRVASILGCSYSTLENHYAQLEAERLVEDKPEKKKKMVKRRRIEPEARNRRY